jgi:glutathione S-transferase
MEKVEDMILFCAPASPFARKVRMISRHLGLAQMVDERFVDTGAPPPEFLAANPLGKIPTLLTSRGTLFDSAVIAAYLDTLAGGALDPPDADRFARMTYEALADGIMDAIVLQVYERRWRAEDRREPRWTAHQAAKVDRGLVQAATIVGQAGHRLQIGDFALAAALGYLDLRFAGDWRDRHPALVRWHDDFASTVPAFEATRYRDPVTGT